MLKGNGKEIKDSSTSYSVADSTYLGNVKINKSIVRRYLILNKGTDTLKITGISVSGTHASEFKVSNIPSLILKNDSTYFYVSFSPKVINNRVAILTINNDDEDEFVYTFGISGTGISPEISIKGNGKEIKILSFSRRHRGRKGI